MSIPSDRSIVSLRRLALHTLAAVGCALVLPGLPAQAQDFPAKQITLVVPFAPGGSTDVAARAVAERMSRTLGQPVVVENKAGASGTIGTEFVARAAPDGYTIGAIGASTGVHPHLMGPQPRYKFDDLTYVGQLAYVEFVLVARKNLEASNVKQLVDLAKARPGKLNYGDSGAAVQLAMELFKNMTRTDIVRVAYKGDTPAIADLVGGHVDLGMLSLAGASAQIKAGTIKVIGVASKTRSKAFPDVPTIAEGGLAGYESGVPTMMAVPKGTPRAVVDRLNAALGEALSDPALIERFTSMGLGVSRYTPAEANGVVKAEYDKLERLLKEAQIPTGR